MVERDQISGTEVEFVWILPLREMELTPTPSVDLMTFFPKKPVMERWGTGEE